MPEPSNRAPRITIPSQPRLQAAFDAFSDFLDSRRVPRFTAGMGLRLSSNDAASVCYELAEQSRLDLKQGRFLVTFNFDRQRVYVGAGSIAWLEPDKAQQSIKPEIPMLNDVEVGDPDAYLDAEEMPVGKDVLIVVRMKEGDATVEAMSQSEMDADEDDLFLVATIKLKTGSGDAGSVGNIVLDTLKQEWASDIPWVKNGSSSAPGDSSSSDASSEGSSAASESEKSSNAIVEMPWHPEGYGALATIESNEVLFEFLVRDVPIRGRVTEVKIDPRFVAVCEPGSFTISLTTDRPYPLGAYVVNDFVVLTALPLFRPRRVTLRLTGVRKGFDGWDMPARTLRQKQINEASLAAMYPR